MFSEFLRIFAVGGLILTQAPAQSPNMADARRRCDELAASPWDVQRAGEGLEVDRIPVKEALPVCRMAAEQPPDDPRYQFQYGRVLSAAGQHVEAFQQYLKSASKGYAAAMTNVGVSYASGRGTARNDSEAVAWYRKAAAGGHLVAMTNLGSMLAHGLGVAKNDAEAAQLYRKAAEGGYPGAMANLGAMYEFGRGVPQDHGEAVRWYRRGAESGNAAAMSSLGWMYDRGQGVKQDSTEAAVWFRKAAESGDARAMTTLGWMYETGRGVQTDQAEAVRWYRRGADAGETQAMRNIGLMYEAGRGLPKNEAEAVRWFRRAADAGHPDALKDLERLNTDGPRTTVTSREFRTLPPVDQQRLLERLVNNIITAMSSSTDASGQPKTEAQRRADRAGANLTRALFTRAPTEKSTDQPLGYVELYRQMKAPDAPLDKPIVEILAEYLGKREAQWIDEKILALGDPQQEEALRNRVVYAEAEFYSDELDAAMRFFEEARREEAEAEAALEIWRMVEEGDAMHRQGRHAEELATYRRAAERGNATAMCHIALMYGNGDGVPRNESVDFEWSLKCAQAGNAYGMWRVSLAQNTDSDLSRNFFPNIPKDARASFEWALKAAQLGHRLAMRNLAAMYGEGRGTTKNIAEANRWMKLSYEKGGEPLGASGNAGK